VKRFSIAAIICVAMCAAASSVEPPVAKTEPDKAAIKATQDELTEAKKLVAALQRRLKATDDERIEAQARLVLMRDEISRLSDELETARKVK
jgi:peptidoglycan hydrolase CwlO-like protein